MVTGTAPTDGAGSAPVNADQQLDFLLEELARDVQRLVTLAETLQEQAAELVARIDEVRR